EQLAAMEDVVMVGYPIGLWDNLNNFPLLRRGISASHPAVDFCGKPEGVIDIGAFPGSSGSPVLILNEGTFATPNGYSIGSRMILLGVLWGGPVRLADGTLEIVEIPTKQVPIARTSLPVHLGYYIKARELLVLKEHLFATFNVK
ncbi:MAG TPA: serine protease, partial [Chloroflexota bacterium]|nr:serine protease [Chloroflexota bacterium]